MSDYVRAKVIRIPFPQEVLEKCNTEDPFDCEEYLKEQIKDGLYDNKEKSFQLGYSDKAYYIDWVYYYTYGEEAGDWGHVSMLSDKEYETIKPIFDKLPFEVKREEMRKVDYCYYNCCECTDYYDIVEVEEDLI